MIGPEFNPLPELFRMIFESLEFLQGLVAAAVISMLWLVIKIVRK